MTGKISMVGASEDGDKIYCLYREGTDVLLRGFYDFEKESFFICEFYTKKLKPEQTPKSVIMSLKEILDIDYDWELKDDESIIRNIEEGIISAKRKYRKKRKNNI